MARTQGEHRTEKREMYETVYKRTFAGQIEELRQARDAFLLGIYQAFPAARKKRLAKRLVYAAYNRCPCGAGLAHDPKGESGVPTQGYWDCSAILLDEAIPQGEEGWESHTAKLPFVFYEIKSEKQPSAEGSTTRPK